MTQLQELGRQIVEGLYDTGMILTWYRNKHQGWELAATLQDGRHVWSPYYINLRLLPSSPDLYRLVGEAMGMMLKELGYEPSGRDKIVGVAMAGIPIADSVALLSGIPALYTRKLPDDVRTPDDVKRYVESHGQHALVEGDFESGDRLVIADDLVTRFDSKLLAISQVNQEAERRGISMPTIQDVLVLLDRGQGGSQRARELGYNLHSLVPFVSKGLPWLRDRLSEIEHELIVDYVRDTSKYQDPELQRHLKQLAESK